MWTILVKQLYSLIAFAIVLLSFSQDGECIVSTYNSTYKINVQFSVEQRTKENSRRIMRRRLLALLNWYMFASDCVDEFMTLRWERRSSIKLPTGKSAESLPDFRENRAWRTEINWKFHFRAVKRVRVPCCDLWDAKFFTIVYWQFGSTGKRTTTESNEKKDIIWRIQNH